jgi:hypothetical protein
MPQFKPRFTGCWPWQVACTNLGNTERQTHPSSFVGKLLTPPHSQKMFWPREPMWAKLLQYCALCGMNDIAYKSMRFLSALSLHNMYMPQNCSSAIKFNRIIHALYKALFVIWDELEQLILGMWRSQVARNMLWGQELIKIQINPSVWAIGEHTYPMMDGLV